MSTYPSRRHCATHKDKKHKVNGACRRWYVGENVVIVDPPPNTLSWIYHKHNHGEVPPKSRQVRVSLLNQSKIHKIKCIQRLPKVIKFSQLIGFSSYVHRERKIPGQLYKKLGQENFIDYINKRRETIIRWFKKNKV